ncbi:MAG: hypothetical protein QME16_00100 [Planctomycetota bacterium]|nr:hypothetical protein [Planctomycetota bacterium]
MRKLLLALFLVTVFANRVLCAPSNSMSITPSATDGTTITASDENTRNNEVSTKFNAHDHNDIDQTANTLSVGDATSGNKQVSANNADTNKPFLRYDDTNNYWIFSDDGVAPSIVIHGNSLIMEGTTDNTFETTLSITDPTADRTQTFQDNGGIIPLGTAGNTLLLTTTGATNVTLPTSGTLIASAHQSSQASDTTDTTTTSTSYVDLLSMSVTLTTGANPCLVIYSGDFYNNIAGGETQVIIDLDGSDQQTTERISRVSTGSYNQILAGSFLSTPGVGSHTWKMQWKVSANTGTCVERTMQVIELK